MVWDAEELSSPVVFRWYRSCWTDLLPVTLTLSDPFTTLELRWSGARTAYESRPVVLRCGRYSGTLRVGGVTRPLVPFRVTRFTFEVLLFLSDATDSGADELDLPRYTPHLGSFVPARLRVSTATASSSPPSPSTRALELKHRELVTRLAGAALLNQLSADVRQLRRATSANERHVEALARELRHERLQRRLAEAVRHEVALLRTGRASHQPGRRRRRPPPAPPAPPPAEDDGEWEDLPESPSRRTPPPEASRPRVTFEEPTEKAEKGDHLLEDFEMEKDFAYEDLCLTGETQEEVRLKTKHDRMDAENESFKDEQGPSLSSPYGSSGDLYATHQADPDLEEVTDSPPFVVYRTVGRAEVAPWTPPRWRLTREVTPIYGLPLLPPWRPRYPADLTPGQRATVLTGGQVIRGRISHIWSSSSQTLVNIETNGWEDVTVPFEKVLMVE